MALCWKAEMRNKFITGLILLMPFIGFSQGEFNKWYFGQQAAVDFNTSPPTPLLDNPEGIGSNATISVSDSLGNLLFYSYGYRVRNRNHQIMSNGTLAITGLNYPQPIFSAKKPGADSIYYIFTLQQLSGAPFQGGLLYSVVDMRLNGGLGDIVAGMKNVAVNGAENAVDRLHGTRHKNNKDVWIVTRNVPGQDFVSCLVTSAGVSNTSVSSPGTVQVNTIINTGEMKISQDGSKLISTYFTEVTNFQYNHAAEFCSFNSETGAIIPLFRFVPVHGADSCYPQYVEFSPDSRLVYVSGPIQILPENQTASGIFQYDATKTDSAEFMQSQVFLGYGDNQGVRGLQMAPDGKIYGVKCCFTDFLSAINNPNVPGTGCNFQSLALNLNGKYGWDGLPQFLQKYKAYIHHTGICQDELFNFSADIWPTPDTIQWNFGDPASGIKNISASANPSHTYLLPGTYTVQLYVRHNDARTDTSWGLHGHRYEQSGVHWQRYNSTFGNNSAGFYNESNQQIHLFRGAYGDHTNFPACRNHLHMDSHADIGRYHGFFH